MKLLIFVMLIIVSNLSFAKSKGIKNITLASDGIFRGARPLNETEILKLKDLGIKSILDLQGGDLRSKYWKIVARYEPGETSSKIEEERQNSQKTGLQFLNLPLNSLDEISAEDNQRIDQALDFIQNKENQPVYLHCEHGKDRTGLVVALYKIKYEGIDPDLAYQEWINLGHNKKSQKFTGNLDKYFFKKVKEIKENYEH